MTILNDIASVVVIFVLFAALVIAAGVVVKLLGLKVRFARMVVIYLAIGFLFAVIFSLSARNIFGVSLVDIKRCIAIFSCGNLLAETLFGFLMPMLTWPLMLFIGLGFLIFYET